MKKLTDKEKSYLQLNLDGKDFDGEGFIALGKAVSEGRLQADKSRVAVEWKRRCKKMISALLVNALMNKRADNYYIDPKGKKILKDYEEKGILPKL